MTLQDHAGDYSITPVEERVHIAVDDAEVVSSSKALRLSRPGQPDRIYVPMEEIRADLLLATDDHRDTDLGEIHLYTIRSATTTVEKGAEYVSETAPGAEALHDHVHFLTGKVEYKLTEK